MSFSSSYTSDDDSSESTNADELLHLLSPTTSELDASPSPTLGTSASKKPSAPPRVRARPPPAVEEVDFDAPLQDNQRKEIKSELIGDIQMFVYTSLL